MHRRRFLKQTFSATLLSTLGSIPLSALTKPNITKLTILHTNDVHSRIEPFPMDGGRNAGLGGTERRAGIIRAIRREEEHVLLLDSGDIWQGTPYFNFFGGELEFKLMSEMKYDAATIGNHDFDAGIEGLVKQLPHASFPFLNCNYEVRDTALFDHIQPFRVFSFGSVRVGVTGVGIELAGLVPDKLYGDVRYLDPVEHLSRTAAFLKEEEKCDYVICLSHLGYNYGTNKIDDRKLARSTRHVDLILGGHTHTFMPGPEVLGNRNNKPVTIHQVGWAGIILGRLDVYFERGRKDHCITCENRLIEPNS